MHELMLDIKLCVCVCACVCTLVLVLVFTTARTGSATPIQGVSQQKAERLVTPLAAETPVLSAHLHTPLSALGYSSMGLQDP